MDTAIPDDSQPTSTIEQKLQALAKDFVDCARGIIHSHSMLLQNQFDEISSALKAAGRAGDATEFKNRYENDYRPKWRAVHTRYFPTNIPPLDKKSLEMVWAEEQASLRSACIEMSSFLADLASRKAVAKTPEPVLRIGETLRDGKLRRLILALELGEQMTASLVSSRYRRPLAKFKGDVKDRRFKSRHKEKILAMLNSIPGN